MTVAARCGAAGCWSCIVTVAVDVAAVVVVQVVVAAAAVVAVDVSVDVTVEVAVEVPRGGGRGDCRGIGRGGGQPPRRPLRRPWPWLLAALHIIHYMLVGSSVGAQTVLVCQDNHQENWSHRSPLVGTCQMSLHTPPVYPFCVCLTSSESTAKKTHHEPCTCQGRKSVSVGSVCVLASLD